MATVASPGRSPRPPVIRSPVVPGVILLLSALPLLSPFPPSTDGHTHIYNAAVAYSLSRQEASPYAGQFEVVARSPAEGLFHPMVVAAGPIIGWEAAERGIVVLLSLVGVLAMCFAVGSTAPTAVVISGWMASSWFLRMGFYDFTMSLLTHAVLVGVLRTKDAETGLRWAFAPLMVAFLTHNFTMLVSSALLAWQAVGRAWHQRRPALALYAVPAGALAAYALAFSGAGGSDASWINPLRHVAGIALSDFLVSLSPSDVVAGAVLTGLLGLGALRARDGERHVRLLAMFGGLLVLASIAAPDAVGEGSYIGIRARALGAVTVLPLLPPALKTLRYRTRRTLTFVLLILLTVHVGAAIRAARSADADLTVLLAELEEAGARPGSFVDAYLTSPEHHHFRISGYLRLLDRAALRLELISFSNYAAYQNIFPVRWSGPVPRLDYVAADGELRMIWSVTSRPDPLFVVHDCSLSLRDTARVTRVCRGRIGVSRLDGTG